VCKEALYSQGHRLQDTLGRSQCIADLEATPEGMLVSWKCLEGVAVIGKRKATQ